MARNVAVEPRVQRMLLQVQDEVLVLDDADATLPSLDGRVCREVECAGARRLAASARAPAGLLLLGAILPEIMLDLRRAARLDLLNSTSRRPSFLPHSMQDARIIIGARSERTHKISTHLLGASQALGVHARLGPRRHLLFRPDVVRVRLKPDLHFGSIGSFARLGEIRSPPVRKRRNMGIVIFAPVRRDELTMC